MSKKKLTNRSSLNRFILAYIIICFVGISFFAYGVYADISRAFLPGGILATLTGLMWFTLIDNYNDIYEMENIKDFCGVNVYFIWCSFITIIGSILAGYGFDTQKVLPCIFGCIVTYFGAILCVDLMCKIKRM